MDANSWLDAGLAFFYPNLCQICGSQRATATQGYVCADCSNKVRFIQPPFCHRCGLPFEGDIHGAFECQNCKELELEFDAARAAVVANGVVREILHRYKYRGELWFEPFLAQLLLTAAQPDLAAARPDFMIPVPLHAVKRREREFNQAERLAARLSEATDIPVRLDLIERHEPTRTQTLLTREERRKNVNHAFRARPATPIKGARCVMIDDVLTTGATTSACARILRSQGAKAVQVWTVARGT